MIALTANRLILSDVCWALWKPLSMSAKQMNSGVRRLEPKGMPDPQVTQIGTLLSTSSF